MMEMRIVLFLVRIDIRNKGRIQSIIFDEVTCDLLSTLSHIAVSLRMELLLTQDT